MLKRIRNNDNGLKRKDKPNGKPHKKPGPKREFSEEQIHMIECFAKLGATNNDFADFFGVAVQTIDLWARTRPAFYNAKLRGGIQFDAKIAAAAARRAMGYDYTKVEEKTDSRGKVTRTVSTMHVPPDTGAFVFWLANRQPDKWQNINRMKHEHSGNINHDHRKIEEIDITQLSERAQEFLFEAGMKQLGDGTSDN